jgi:hypothetical protein
MEDLPTAQFADTQLAFPSNVDTMYSLDDPQAGVIGISSVMS